MRQNKVWGFPWDWESPSPHRPSSPAERCLDQDGCRTESIHPPIPRDASYLSPESRHGCAHSGRRHQAAADDGDVIEARILKLRDELGGVTLRHAPGGKDHAEHPPVPRLGAGGIGPNRVDVRANRRGNPAARSYAPSQVRQGTGPALFGEEELTPEAVVERLIVGKVRSVATDHGESVADNQVGSAALCLAC